MARQKKVELAVVLEGLRAKASLTQIAKKLSVSVQAVSKLVRFLEGKGALIRKGKSPAVFEVNSSFNFANVGYDGFNFEDVKGFSDLTSSNPKRVSEPHRFGEWFKVGLGVPLRYASREWCLKGGAVCQSWREKGFSIVRRGGRIEFWLKGFRGLRALEQVVEGRRLIRERAALFASEQGVELSWGGYCGGREWTAPNAGLASSLVDGLVLKGGKRRLGGKVDLWTDASHEGKPEWSSVEKRVPLDDGDDFARRLEKLIWGGVEKLDLLSEDSVKTKAVVEKAVADMMARIKTLEARQEGGAITPVKAEERRDVS